MRVVRGLRGLFVVGLLLSLVGAAEAQRVPTIRAAGFYSSGARRDITVPYLTTGRTTYMSGFVSPRVYSSPVIEDFRHPGSKPVFNLPFYGAVMSFGDRSNGALPRPR